MTEHENSKQTPPLKRWGFALFFKLLNPYIVFDLHYAHGIIAGMKKPLAKKKKDITLNDLALMMGRGFNEVGEKFDEVHENIAELREEFSELKEDFNDLHIAIDGYAKKSDTYFQEMVMLAHKVDRMERWILQLAEKTGVQLKA